MQWLIVKVNGCNSVYWIQINKAPGDTSDVSNVLFAKYHILVGSINFQPVQGNLRLYLL